MKGFLLGQYPMTRVQNGHNGTEISISTFHQFVSLNSFFLSSIFHTCNTVMIQTNKVISNIDHVPIPINYFFCLVDKVGHFDSWCIEFTIDCLKLFLCFLHFFLVCQQDSQVFFFSMSKVSPNCGLLKSLILS